MDGWGDDEGGGIPDNRVVAVNPSDFKSDRRVPY